MIAHDVSRADDFATNVGPLLHIAPNQEESRTNLMLSQDLQKTQRMRIVGPVIIGERDLLA